MKQFQGGLVCKVHRLLYHSTLGVRVINKRKKGNRKRVTPESPGTGFHLHSCDRDRAYFVYKEVAFSRVTGSGVLVFNYCTEMCSGSEADLY